MTDAARFEPGRVGAHEFGTIERAFDEGERLGRARHRGQTVNDDPQPQVDFAFGLRIVNCAPCRLSV